MSEPPQSQADRETDALAERFFSQPPQAWEVEPEAWRPSPLSKTESLAMLATVAPVVIAVTVAVGWLLLSNPLFASAEPEPQAQVSAKSAAAAPRASHDATQHGLTALAKVAPIEAPVEPRAQPDVQPKVAPPAAEPHPAEPVPVAAAAPIAPARVAAARVGVASSTPLKRARQALDAGDAGRARELALEAIAREPTRAAAYIVLAGALDALGDRAGKQAAFRSCAERATDTLASACKSLAR
jgi:hypothetical protein